MSVLNDLEDLGIPDLPVRTVTEETTSPIHAQWAKFRPLFEAAMKDGLHDIVSIERALGQGTAILFPGKNSAIIAEKVVYASGISVFQATWSVGDLEEVLSLAPGVEAIGRSLGCSEMIIEGRRAWEKVLKPMGYEFWSLTVKKSL